MNIVFLGSSHFAVPSLRAMIESGYEISAVVTQPDKKKGRGMHLGHTDIKDIAEAAKLKVYQPQDINADVSVKFLKSLGAEIIVVVAYGQILSQEVLGIPKVFTVNLHASLLPGYRGAAPINRAIMNGDKETGVTVMKVVKKMDAGPIILQERLDIGPEDNAVTLESRMSEAGAGLLIKALRAVQDKKFELATQDEKKATFAPKISKIDGLIDWGRAAAEINNLIRGCYGWPGAFTHYNGKLLKIYKAEPVPGVTCEGERAAGKIIGLTKDMITVATGKGDLIVEELQIEGARRMLAEEFIAGHKIAIGDMLEDE